MEKPAKTPRKISPLSTAILYLVLVFMAQLFVLWVVGKIFPAIACGAFADESCKPQPVTEGLIVGALVPLVFIPFAVMQCKQIVMYAGALVPIRKLGVLLASSTILIIMVWQLVTGIGALLSRWFS